MKLTGKTVALSCCLVFATTAKAQLKLENTETSIQYAYALSSSEDKALAYGAASNKLETFRIQHEHDYNLGSNFVLYDRLSSDKPLGGPVFGPYNPAAYAYGDGNKTYFMVLGTELHASKVLGTAVGTGLIKDFGLSARYQKGGYYDFEDKQIGPQIHLNVPGFDKFKIAVWRTFKSDISGSAGQGGNDVGTRRDYKDSWAVGLDWKTTWRMAGYDWSSQMFLRHQIKDGGKAGATGNQNVNGIPGRWWIEPDIFVHINKNFAIGLRDYYLQQTDAIDNGYSTSGKKSHHVPQIVLKASF